MNNEEGAVRKGLIFSGQFAAVKDAAERKCQTTEHLTHRKKQRFTLLRTVEEWKKA